MGDTRRHCDEGWRPGNPDFDSLYPDIVSRKHQEKDRPPTGMRQSHRFSNRVRNRRENLLQKIDELKLKESLEE